MSLVTFVIDFNKYLQMNSTYLRVWENVDAEWKYSKCFFQVNFLLSTFQVNFLHFILTLTSDVQVQFLTPRAILPPPFRWFYYLARLVK